ncbi:MAG TPA: ClpXP protease specificity-enhancing factor SspB [Hyphomonas sp.]|nr:stringent starvation protein B [Hyphomonas sp.]HRJ00053.1 ClpXP protease specificity-enhancing factor SspB [Hyphomonas sp.]HRK66237.1 ClpXP protease specificity-enhancing factor SspB [Hyphomonas sp.]
MTDYIGYEALSQAAMRGVVREALRRAKTNGGLPGDHHFYVSFRTRAPGVKIADHLVQRFPEEMTIVIQHQFWDLEVHDGHFEIVLKFAGVPQHLSIPLAAITRFVDPSVNFGLSFEARSRDTGVLSPAKDTAAEPVPPKPAETVVSLDAYRRK